MFIKQKNRLDIDREIPELSSVDNDQINMSFYQVIYRSIYIYGAVNHLIKMTGTQNKRIRKIEEFINIINDDTDDDDTDEVYDGYVKCNEFYVNCNCDEVCVKCNAVYVKCNCDEVGVKCNCDVLC